jgi:transposase-like protein
MEFRVGNIRAKCPGCEGTDFSPPPDDRAGPHIKYACKACGTAWTYARLIGQIGRETMRRKNGRLSPDEEKLTRSLPYFLRRNV